jgi:probable rRNA maturation factor
MPKKSQRSARTTSTPQACKVRVSAQAGPRAGAKRETIRRRAQKMLAHLRLHDVELSVALVDDATIQELNHRYRGKNRPTDVLAFALSEGEPLPRTSPELLGDVIISVAMAERQALQAGRPWLEELTTLLAHGLLHLLGHDHPSHAAALAMSNRTTELVVAASSRRRA